MMAGVEQTQHAWQMSLDVIEAERPKTQWKLNCSRNFNFRVESEAVCKVWRNQSIRVFGRSESFYRQSNVVYASDIDSLDFWKFSFFLTVVFSLATRHGLAGALFFSDLQRFRWRDRRLSVFPIARRFHRAMHWFIRLFWPRKIPSLDAFRLCFPSFVLDNQFPPIFCICFEQGDHMKFLSMDSSFVLHKESCEIPIAFGHASAHSARK